MEVLGTFLIVIWIVLVACYFAPTAVALSRHHHQAGAIVVINVFLGWTLVGWVVAMAMACSSTPPPSLQTVVNVNRDPPLEQMKLCPRCAETLKAAATVCRYCNYEFVRAGTDGAVNAPQAAKTSMDGAGTALLSSVSQPIDRRSDASARTAANPCPGCRASNDAASRFCYECGTALAAG